MSKRKRKSASPSTARCAAVNAARLAERAALKAADLEAGRALLKPPLTVFYRGERASGMIVTSVGPDGVRVVGPDGGRITEYELEAHGESRPGSLKTTRRERSHRMSAAPTARSLPRSVRGGIFALEFVALAVPPRLAAEEVGDARERVARLQASAAPAWKLALVAWSATFWVALNAIREIIAGLMGKRSGAD